MVINYSGKKILHTILKKNDFPSKKNYHVIIISYLIISQLPSKKENNFLSKKKNPHPRKKRLILTKKLTDFPSEKIFSCLPEINSYNCPKKTNFPGKKILIITGKNNFSNKELLIFV